MVFTLKLKFGDESPIFCLFDINIDYYVLVVCRLYCFTFLGL